jgi:uridine kinase
LSEVVIDIKEYGKVTIDSRAKFSDIFRLIKIEYKYPIILVKHNNEYYELEDEIKTSGELEWVDIRNPIAFRAYVTTLQFIFIKAAKEIFPKCRVTIEHSLRKNTFGEIQKEEPLTENDLIKIKQKMIEIIKQNKPISKKYVSKDEALKIFKQYGMDDKIRLLKNINERYILLYELDDTYDYFYGLMASYTGCITLFDLIYYNPGFLLRYPTDVNPDRIIEFKDQKKLNNIFYETKQWVKILGIEDVWSLNDKVEKEDASDIIRVAEALHEKKIAYIADMIHSRENVKLVLIAGPSSSGKTTFSKRLGIQLRVNGFIPVTISLDDYFVNRDKTPQDEYGEYDFESIYALDLELFNDHINKLLKGYEVEIPSFNFKEGTREWVGHKLKIPSNGIMVVEGIHGLNEILTSSVNHDNKFKIYISALTQLNLDDHNRIATTDVRILRRIVRDYLSRGFSVEHTLKMWSSIKRGEEKNIFPFQECADVMFNSSLAYELSVLKKFAMRELNKVTTDSSVYCDANRLKSFLSTFKELDEKYVPENSILREFVGGSCFYKY